MESYIRRATFREPKPSDKKLDFATYHDTVMAVSRMVAIDLSQEITPPVLRMIVLDEELPSYDPTRDPDPDTGNLPYIDRTGTVLYYNLEDQTWQPDTTQQKVNICNPYSGLSYARGDRGLFLYLAQAGKFIPVSPSDGRIPCWCYHDIPAYAICLMKSVLDPTIITDNPIMRVSRFGLVEPTPNYYWIKDDPPEEYNFLDPSPTGVSIQDTFANYADIGLYQPRPTLSDPTNVNGGLHVFTGVSGYYNRFLHTALRNARVLVNGAAAIPAKTVFFARQPFSRVCWALYDEEYAEPEEWWFFPVDDRWGLASYPKRMMTPAVGYPGHHNYPSEPESYTMYVPPGLSGWGSHWLTRVARGHLFRRMGRANTEKKIVPVVMESLIFGATE